jgi:uncharacterized protein YndB with AHSA1/START domain
MPADVNPDLDLELVAETPLWPDQLFDGWTQPDILKHWFCPRPWRVIDCEIDLRPGGLFCTTMQSPEGQTQPDNRGCYLVVERPHRLVWTNLMSEGYRPNVQKSLGFGFVCDLRFSPRPAGGTIFHVVVKHAQAESRIKHQDMGFDQGWRIALSQLEAWYQGKV